MARSLRQLLETLIPRGARFCDEAVSRSWRLPRRRSASSARRVMLVILAFGIIACTPQADVEPPRTPTLAGVLQLYQTPSPSPIPLTATPIPTRTPAPTPTPHLYTVKAGDTLGSIALEFGFDMGDLVNANPDISPYAMSIGQEIVIPEKDAETVVTAVELLPIPYADPNCYTTLSGGMWCFVLVQNDTENFIEGISFAVQVYDGTGVLVADESAYPLLDRVAVGESMPAVVYFDSAPAEWQAYAELLTAFEGSANDGNYLPVNLTSVLTQIAWDGKSAQVSGQVLVDGEAEQVWVLATAFDAADQVVGVRRWESAAGGQSFEITIASLGPEIARVSLSAEAKR